MFPDFRAQFASMIKAATKQQVSVPTSNPASPYSNQVGTTGGVGINSGYANSTIYSNSSIGLTGAYVGSAYGVGGATVGYPGSGYTSNDFYQLRSLALQIMPSNSLDELKKPSTKGREAMLQLLLVLEDTDDDDNDARATHPPREYINQLKLLKELAGTNGKFFAQLKIAQLGLNEIFKYWD